ncbi:MAG: type II toxin-antitoxin system HicA family toxin [Methylococcales bacterium]
MPGFVPQPSLRNYDQDIQNTSSQVGKHDTIIDVILRGASDANISFHDIRGMLLNLGFEERIRGSHHLYRKPGIEEKLNIQRAGNKAKPYQVKQIREIILKYHLTRK